MELLNQVLGMQRDCLWPIFFFSKNGYFSNFEPKLAEKYLFLERKKNRSLVYQTADL